MSSGTNAWRAGTERASTVPLSAPNQMKSQNVTLPVNMTEPSTTVAAPFRLWAAKITRLFGSRSASTPPHSENTAMGSMKDRVTQARSSADDVNV